MAWYRAGTVAVTNGSVLVTGAGTAWVGNAQAGHAINLPDGRVYEVLSVDSNVQITLGSAYLGGTAAGQAYSIQPNQGFAQAAATKLTDFLAQIGGWVSGALAGRFGDGSLAAPGISFAVDQDTGLRRSADNMMTLVTGGVDRLIATPTGAEVRGVLAITGSGNTPPNPKAMINVGSFGSIAYDSGNVATAFGQNFYTAGGSYYGRVGGAASGARFGNDGVTFFQNAVIADAAFTPSVTLKLDSNGNMLVGGILGASSHEITKGVGEGSVILAIRSNSSNQRSVVFSAVASADSWNGAGSAMYIGRHSSTSRSLSAGGTINASGADYAEYMLKAVGCGQIAKGDVCGVDRDGKLTKAWADAISFVVKSTDPSLVGGDNWAAHLPPRPEQGEDEDAAASESRLAAWEAELEEARLCVDRIAFCGQVPCNVTGDFEVGDYIVAAANGGGIKAVAVKADDMTLPQYMRRIGKVWAIRDGRAWIDVQHG